MHASVNPASERSDPSTGPPPADLRVVVVNWNAGRHLADCLRGLQEAPPARCRIEEITVVDNDSHDGSLSDLPQGPLPLRILRNGANLGFARGCNQGAADSTARHLLFLNPDTLVPAKVLDACLARMDRAGEAGTAVLGVRLLTPEGSPLPLPDPLPGTWTMLWEATGLNRLPSLFPGLMGFRHGTDAVRRVGMVCGAFLWIRREVFEALDGFDEDYFLYMEECDLCLRVRQRGHEVLHLGSCEVHHVGGACSGRDPAERLHQMLRSKRIYARKHLGMGARFVWTVATLLIEPLARLVRAVATLSPARFLETLRAYRRVFSSGRKSLPPS